MTQLYLFRPNMPAPGGPCTIEQLAEWICDRASPDFRGSEGQCPHAARCAAQPVGDSWCFLAQERVRKRRDSNPEPHS